VTLHLLALLLFSRTAAAHGIDAHRVQVELDGAVVRVAVTPGVDAFPDADQDGNAILDRAEVAAARGALRARFEFAFHLEDPQGEAPACAPASISTVGNGEGHVRASLHCTFRAPPEAIVVRMNALGWFPYTLEAVRTRQVAPGRWGPDGEVVGGTIAAGGGVVTLLARSPGSTVPTRNHDAVAHATQPDTATSGAWVGQAVVRWTAGIALTAFGAALLRAWRRHAATRPGSRPAASPSRIPTGTLPTTEGPPR
jgi:hypothetical protein